MRKFENETKTSPILKAVALAGVVGMLSACGAKLTDDPVRYDPRTAHPIQVASEQVSVTLSVPMQGAELSPADYRRLRNFIREFVDRGRTVVTVESQMPDRARQILEAYGLRSNEINIVADTTVRVPMALLTFTANVAKVPNCGDWSEPYTFNPTNMPAPDFGCSNRRNLGLTVADPGDLIDHQPVSGRGAARRDTVLDSYNAGETIGPAPQTIDTRSVSATTDAGN